MNVNDRKMFKPRPARNQLNQMGGIMASSPQLVDTVARFNLGGNVSLAQMQQANDPRFFSRLGANIANLPAAAYDTLVGFPASTLQNAATAVQYSPFGRALGMSEYGETAPPTVGAQPAQAAIRDVLQANQPLTPEQVALRNQPAGIGVLAPAGAEDAAMSAQLGQNVFGEGYGMPEEVDPFVMPGVTTAPAEQEQPAVTEPPAPPQVPVQTDAELTADAKDNAEVVAAAKRGELGAAEQVKAVVQQGTPQEQQEQLTQLMNEFKKNAPEFEGSDRGLALAKIGFAMAAGQSPNALTNIASALNEGADALIKDKRERDAFKRQVDLSALQYGLGEVSKERAQQRLDERTFAEFVDQETGEPVRVSNAEYFANGNKLPKGLMNKELYTKIQTGINERAKASLDLLKDAQDRRFLKPNDAKGYREDYASLVDQASESETAAAFLEKVISSAAEDDITGPYAAAKSAAAKVGTVFGVKMPESFTTRDRAIQDLKAALQPMVKVTLGNTQSANSISDRDVNLLIQGFLADGIMNENADGVLNFIAVPQEVFVNSLQNGLRQIRKSQASTLNNMSAIESELADLYTPAGRVGTSLLEPYQQKRSASTPRQGAKTLQLDPETGQYFIPDLN